MKVKAKALKDLIQEIMDGKINESWNGADSMPMKPNEPTKEEQASIVQPSTETQVSDTDLPINDENWRPGNLKEMGMAMKQMAEHIPESQIGFVWMKLKKIIDKSLDNVDPGQMEQRVADINTKLTPQ